MDEDEDDEEEHVAMDLEDEENVVLEENVLEKEVEEEGG